MSASGGTDLASRYGTTAPHRRPVLVAAVVMLGGLATAWLVWAMLFHGRPQVDSNMVSFDVRGQHEATATFTVVRRSESVEASCLLRALAEDHSVVGELNVPVDSTDNAQTTVTTSLRTEREATSVDLVGCTAPGQTRRR